MWGIINSVIIITMMTLVLPRLTMMITSIVTIIMMMLSHPS